MVKLESLSNARKWGEITGTHHKKIKIKKLKKI